MMVGVEKRVEVGRESGNFKASGNGERVEVEAEEFQMVDMGERLTSGGGNGENVEVDRSSRSIKGWWEWGKG